MIIFVLALLIFLFFSLSLIPSDTITLSQPITKTPQPDDTFNFTGDQHPLLDALSCKLGYSLLHILAPPTVVCLLCDKPLTRNHKPSPMVLFTQTGIEKKLYLNLYSFSPLFFSSIYHPITMLVLQNYRTIQSRGKFCKGVYFSKWLNLAKQLR